MKHPIAQRAERKATNRDRKRTTRMKVSGKSVLTLKRILGQRARRPKA